MAAESEDYDRAEEIQNQIDKLQKEEIPRLREMLALA